MPKRPLFPINIDKWDSYFFNVPVARLTISGKKEYRGLYEEIMGLLKRAKEKKVKFIFLRLKSPTALYEKKLLRAGLKDCGEYVNLVYRWSRPLDINPVEGYIVRRYRRSDEKKICEISAKAFTLSYLYRSRFQKKSKIDLYHSVWLKNQIKNRNYLIFVAETNSSVAGFVTMNLKDSKSSARMSLMAVHEKHLGRGLGDLLIRSMLKEACRRKRDTHFRTQGNNRFAVPIYTKIGCKLLSLEKMFFKKI